jgi:HlyD family secretion protein
MDVEITSEVRRRRVVKRAAVVVIAIAAAAFCLASTVEWLRPSRKREEIRTARVERGAVEATVQANGTVVPLAEQVVSSPVEARVLRVGRRAGDHVKTGDELLTLDTAASRLETARLDDKVAQLESTSAELRLRLEDTIANLHAQIEQKKLDAEIVHYTAEQKKKLRADGLIA